MRFYALRKILPRRLEHALHALRQPAHSLECLKKTRDAKRRNLKYPHPILLIAGLPKSGTTWVENFLYHVPAYVPCRLGGDIETQIRQDLPATAFSHFPRDAHTFIKTHTNPHPNNFAVISEANIHRTLVMVRDPADVAVSRYYYLLANPKGRGEPGYIDYRGMDKEVALSDSLDVVAKHYIPWIQGWCEQAHRFPDEHLIVRYEDIRENPQMAFESISRFFELALSENDIGNILTRVDESMKARRLKASGSAGTKSTYRKGLSGESRSYFPAEALESFYSQGAETLSALGYGPASFESRHGSA